MNKRLWLKQILFGKTLLDIVNDADVFLQDLLGLKNDVAAVRENTSSADHSQRFPQRRAPRLLWKSLS